MAVPTGGYQQPMGTPERKAVEQEQEDAEFERKGREEAAKDPASSQDEDPRGEQPPPQPFSGPER